MMVSQIKLIEKVVQKWQDNQFARVFDEKDRVPLPPQFGKLKE